MLEIIAGWQEWVQVTVLVFSLVFVVLGTYDTIKTVMYHLAVLFRGWPEKAVTAAKVGQSKREPVIEAISCDHDDNFTGYCLHATDNCKTTTECGQVVAAHNARVECKSTEIGKEEVMR